MRKDGYFLEEKISTFLWYFHQTRQEVIFDLFLLIKRPKISNDLTPSTIKKELYKTIEILEKLVDAKTVLRYLDYRMSLKYSATASQSTVSSGVFPNFSYRLLRLFLSAMAMLAAK